jgi:hypothetical protein
MGPTQPIIQWILKGLSPGVKRLGHKADHPPSSSAEVKNALHFLICFITYTGTTIDHSVSCII